MRKDVRIGLSIGGVLLAVLIVYLLVPKNENGGREKSELAQKDASSLGQGGAAQDGAGQQPAGNGAIGLGNSSAGQGQDTPGTAVTGTGTGTPTPGSETTSTATDADSAGPSDANAGNGAAGNGGADWATILSGGRIPDSMIATRRDDPFANGDGAGNTTNTPRNTPDSPIEWPTGGATGGNQGGTGQAGAAPAGPSPGSGSTGGTGSTGTPVVGTTGVREHTIQPYETLSTIALAAYGDARHYKAIQQANPDLDERKLRPGTKIKLPDLSALKATGGAGGQLATPGTRAEPAVDAGKEYRVQPNDSLQKIALKLYGKAAKADAIYDLNKDKIGADEHRIKVGMILKLPEAPTQGQR